MLKINFLQALSVVSCFASVRTEGGLKENLINSNFERTSKIVGGTNVYDDTSYSWFASYYLHGGETWLSCGGMLITPEYVLTAAHCIQPQDIDQDPIFRIGELCRDNAENCGQHQEDRRVISITIKNKFIKADKGDDFALIRLDKASTIKPVTIDNMALSQHYSQGKSLYALGFGHSSFGGNDSTTLRHVELDYVDPLTCTAAYPGHITGDMMCASRLGKDACHNDSGGPLFDKEANVVVGIVSWGHECAKPGYPGVYARIATEYDWIKCHICSNHNTPLPPFCGKADYCSPMPGAAPDGPLLSTITAHSNSAWRVEVLRSAALVLILQLTGSFWI